MYSDTRFGLVMKGLSRSSFNRLVNQENADKYTKGFSRWDQLVAMIFNQLSGLQSLRQLETSFNHHNESHYHLGTRTIRRSTLADANRGRSPKVFERVLEQLLQSTHRRLKRDLKSMMYLLDSSPFHLVGRDFDDWASQYRSNVSQGLKLHVQLEQQSRTPVYARLTGTQASDISEGRKISIESGATYVFDKGYYDFDWWKSMSDKGAVFVTRLKKNAAVKTVVVHQHTTVHSSILEDATVEFTRRYIGTQSHKNPLYKARIRRIIIDRPDKETPLVLITNDFERSAEEIGGLYKSRWDIELFFKWIKQNLKIKRFLGHNENAVRTQILTALIAYLLVYWYHKRHAVKESLTLCVSALRNGLFQRPETEYQVKKRRRQRREDLGKIQASWAF